jgi:hypothetical protein
MKQIFLAIFIVISFNLFSSSILIPMDETQKDHLKSYGIAYWTLQNGVEVKWLLNYRGGSFLIQNNKEIENECLIRGVSYEIIADVQVAQILSNISQNDVNMDVEKLEKAPKIAVYSPKNKQPWDDAVTLVLTYAEIPYDIIYDSEILDGKLKDYDWLHLHHEDFTGQYGKFYSAYHNTPWYREQVAENETVAQKYGFSKVSELKLTVAKTIKAYVLNGGFMFAMCSATDSYDIALAAENTDICTAEFDYDAIAPNAQEELDFSKTLAFTNFKIEKNPYVYQKSNIDVSANRKATEENDYFSLFEFSAKWDPIPTMLCQNHTNLIRGFMGQSTAFKKDLIKSNVLIMGENKSLNEARYIHGILGKGTWTFY